MQYLFSFLRLSKHLPCIPNSWRNPRKISRSRLDAANRFFTWPRKNDVLLWSTAMVNCRWYLPCRTVFLIKSKIIIIKKSNPVHTAFSGTASSGQTAFSGQVFATLKNPLNAVAEGFRKNLKKKFSKFEIQTMK